MITKIKVEGNGRMGSTKIWAIDLDGTQIDLTNCVSEIEISGTPGPPGKGLPVFKAILHISFTELDIEAVTEQELPIRKS